MNYGLDNGVIVMLLPNFNIVIFRKSTHSDLSEKGHDVLNLHGSDFIPRRECTGAESCDQGEHTS